MYKYILLPNTPFFVDDIDYFVMAPGMSFPLALGKFATEEELRARAAELAEAFDPEVYDV